MGNFCSKITQLVQKTGVWIQWNIMVDWNAEWTEMVEWDKLDALLGSHLFIITTFEQRPPVNKDHLNLMTK